MRRVSLIIAGFLLAAAPAMPGGNGKVRLFILSGQSNMAGLNHTLSFTPTLTKAFPKDEVIVVRSAQGGQSIRRWYRGWKLPADPAAKEQNAGMPPGDLYDVLMDKVRPAIKGKTIDSVTFVWMQGEADARLGNSSIYADALRGLIKQLRDDLKRPDMSVVIGRLSDFRKGQSHWDAIRAAEEKVAMQDPLAAWADTDDLNGPKDGLHYTKDGYLELGRRFAEKSIELQSKGDR